MDGSRVRERGGSRKEGHRRQSAGPAKLAGLVFSSSKLMGGEMKITVLYCLILDSFYSTVCSNP